MASISPTSVQCSPEPHSGKKAYLKLTITSISDSDASTNKRYISWKLTIEGTSWSTLHARYASLGSTEIVPFSDTSVSSWTSGQQINSGTTTFSNDSSGNLTLYAYVKQLFYYSYSSSRWNSSSYSQSAGTNMVCSQLPRYANFKTHSYSSELNKFTVSYTADAAYKAQKYKLDTGSWTNTTAGSYTISGLTPGSTHTIQTQIQRTDSGLWTTSSSLSVKMKSLPTSNTPSNFELGSNPTVSISSVSYLSKWYVDVYDGSTKIKTENNITALSKEIDLTDSTLITNMLSRHTDTDNWDITFKYYCVSNGSTYPLTERTCKCTIPSNSYLPTFTTNNVSYVVTNSASNNLTGSNQKIIKGISDVKVTCTAATPNGSASMSSYSATSGTSTASTTNLTTIEMNLSSVTGNSVTVQATDSRGKSTSVNKVYSAFVDYFAPTVTSINVGRVDGVGKNTTVNITGNYCNWSGLSTTNVITQVSLQYKVKGTQNYTTITGVSLSISHSNGTFTVTGTITGNHFLESNEYDILITLQDKLTQLPILTDIPAGEALLWRDLSNKRIGIKTKPSYALDLDGDCNITGNYKINGVNIDNTLAILQAAYPINSIYLSISPTNPHDIFGFGTWERIANGQYLIGIQDSNPWFDTVGSTGSNGNSGNWNHTHSYAHTHGVPGKAHTHGYGGYYAAISFAGTSGIRYRTKGSISYTPNERKADGGAGYNYSTSQSEAVQVYGTSGSTTPDSVTTNSQSTSTTGSTTHVSPFYAIYVWKRTA